MEFLYQQIVSGVFMCIFFLMSFFGRYPFDFKYDDSNMVSFITDYTFNANSSLFVLAIVCAIWLTIATLFREAAENFSAEKDE